MAPSTKQKILKCYPHLDDPQLPHFIGCPTESSIDEAKKCFKRICFKDAIITAVEPVKANCNPGCIWRIYYQIRNKDYDYKDNDSSNSNIPPTKLPKDEASLKQLFEDLTSKSSFIGMKIARKFYTVDRLNAVVEYFSSECECQLQNFSMVTEEPRMWPIKEAEINFSRLRMHDV